MLPAEAGFFVVDLDWSEGGKSYRIQSLVCPATQAGVDGMHSYEGIIVALLFVPVSSHDLQPRSAPLQINAIATGLDAKHGYRKELLIRTLDGQWHACQMDVNVADVREREIRFELDHEAVAEYLAGRAAEDAAVQAVITEREASCNE